MNIIIAAVVVGIVINVVISILIAKLGEKRRIGATAAFLASFLLSPIIGLVLVLLSEELGKQELEFQEKAKQVSSMSAQEIKDMQDNMRNTMLIVAVIFFAVLFLL